jgi:hypothetical protein
MPRPPDGGTGDPALVPTSDPESQRAQPTLADLPPLPRPDTSTMNSEACCGCSFVLGLTAILVAITHLYALDGISVPFSGSKWWEIFGSLIYVEAAVAVGCLAGLMFGDPGTLKRSELSCFPLPPEVAQWLGNADHPMDPVGPRLGNVTDPSSGKVFCTRCMIWRPDNTCHHCSTCQVGCLLLSQEN